MTSCVERNVLSKSYRFLFLTCLSCLFCRFTASPVTSEIDEINIWFQPSPAPLPLNPEFNQRAVVSRLPNRTLLQQWSGP